MTLIPSGRKIMSSRATLRLTSCAASWWSPVVPHTKAAHALIRQALRLVALLERRATLHLPETREGVTHPVHAHENLDHGELSGRIDVERERAFGRAQGIRLPLQ